MIHMHHSLFHRATAVLCSLLFAGCSFLGSHKQEMQITANNPEAKIFVAGEYVGQGSVLTDIPKKDGIVISAELGDKYDAVILKRTLSGVGVLDTIGGYCLLLPYIGLVSPGAYKFNEEYIELNID